MSAIHTYSSIICIDDYYNKCFTTVSISSDRNLYGFGFSKYGSHGNEEDSISSPKQIVTLINITMIDCGACHLMCIDHMGHVYGFGNNDKGQLGIGEQSFNKYSFPQKVNLPPITQLSCTDYSTTCLSNDGELYVFGNNYFNQLGIECKSFGFDTPQQISDFNNIEYVVSGSNHVICKSYNNQYFSWGNNEYGQLGQGNIEKKCRKPTECINWPDNVISVKCGGNFSILLTLEGNIYACGFNSTNQLGINDKTIKIATIPTLVKDIPEIQRIECGSRHVMCIDVENNLWVFGFDMFGQLGIGTYKGNIQKPTMISTLKNVIDISSRGERTFVKTSDNKIYACGHNEYSQLGIKTSEFYQKTPIQVFIGNEDIWCSNTRKSIQKSARK